MNKVCEKNKCTGCGLCKNICPKQAIEMIRNEKGFGYPVINKEKCVNCNICANNCPQNFDVNLKNPLKIVACKSKNFKERMESSSGGVFGEICKEILKNNGAIFGAIFNDEFRVEHNKITLEEELYKIRGSKYVQSDMENVFKEINQNKPVLFSGTPCQVNAVKKYVKSDSENIFYVDIICHGVPSPKVFEDYKKYLEEIYNSKIININFRYKNEKSIQNIKIDFENGESYISYLDEGDIFYKLFLNNIILRDSCYDCNYKKFERIGDISLGDFWGYEKGTAKDFGDKKGISLVLINTQKGMDMFEKIKNKFDYFEVLKEECYPYNCFSNFEKPKICDEFWKKYIEKGFKSIVDYERPTR